MSTYVVHNKSELETTVSSASSGDIIYMAAGTYTNVRIVSETFSTSNPLRIELMVGTTQAQVVFTGDQADEVDACLNGETENTIDDNNPAIRFQNCTGIIFDGPFVTDSGRGVHVTGGSHITVRNVYVYRVLDRAIGGPTDDLTVEDCIVDMAALENYESRLFFATGSGGGWPAVVGTYKDGSNNPSHRFICRRVTVMNSWGEAIAPFHCDTGEITDCVVWNGSHTVGIYLEQCTNFTVTGNFVIATSGAPVRHDGRIMHGILMAREGTSFAPSLTGMIIHDNVVVGTAAGIRGWNDVDDLLEAVITHCTFINCDSVNYDAVDFEAFTTTPDITIDDCIIEGMTIDDNNGFTITNNWFIGTVPAESDSGGYNATVPVFFNEGNEIDPSRADYYVTNMPSGEDYGALIAQQSEGGGGSTPPAQTSSKYSTGNTGSLTLTVPTDAQSGNKWIIAAISAREYKDDSVVTAHPDWNLLATVSPPTDGSKGRLDVYTKPATGSEPDEYTWTIDVATGMCGIMHVVDDIDVANAIVDFAIANGELTNQAVGASVTTEQNNAPVFYIGMVNSSSTNFGAISGFTPIVEVECDGGAFLSCAMFKRIKSSAGATGPITSELTNGTKEFAIVTLAMGVPVEEEPVESSNPQAAAGDALLFVPFEYVLSTPRTKIEVVLGDA